jgi:hypothetical protein
VLGVIRVTVRRLTAWRCDSNVVTVLDPAWLAWLRLRRAGVRSNPCPARGTREERRAFGAKGCREEGAGGWKRSKALRGVYTAIVVPLTVEERVTLTVLADHVGTLKDMLAKAEAAGERLGQERDEARRDLLVAQAEAAFVPALRTTVEVLKAALESEKGRVRELRAERDRLPCNEYVGGKRVATGARHRDSRRAWMPKAALIRSSYGEPHPICQLTTFVCSRRWNGSRDDTRELQHPPKWPPSAETSGGPPSSLHSGTSQPRPYTRSRSG